MTICTQDKVCLFGHVINSEMVLNEMGNIVQDEWLRTEAIWSNVKCGAFVIMPNHFHGIVVITKTVGATHERAIRESPLHVLYEFLVCFIIAII